MILRFDVEFLTRRWAGHDTGGDRLEWPPAPGRFLQALVHGAVIAGIDHHRLGCLEHAPVVLWLPPEPDVDHVYMAMRETDLAQSGAVAVGMETHLGAALDTIAYDWDIAAGDLEACETAARNVPWFGRSSSPVVISVTREPTGPPAGLDRWELADTPSRHTAPTTVPWLGMIHHLDLVHDAGPAGRLHRRPAAPAHYQPAALVHSTNWELLATYRTAPRPGSETLHVAERVRRRVLGALGDDAETLKGSAHHLGFAVLPLPYVGYDHADGRILGVGIAVHDHHSPPERARLLNALNHTNGVTATDTLPAVPYTLAPRRWTQPAAVWSSVTPVVLDRPASSNTRRARNLADAVERRCGIRPHEVLLHDKPLLRGSHHPWTTKQVIHQPGCSERTWAQIAFTQPVTGPVLAGRTASFGIGLFAPEPNRT